MPDRVPTETDSAVSILTPVEVAADRAAALMDPAGAGNPRRAGE
jgi:hypothetical protein